MRGDIGARRTRVGFGAVIVAVAVVATACGGSGSDDEAADGADGDGDATLSDTTGVSSTTVTPTTSAAATTTSVPAIDDAEGVVVTITGPIDGDPSTRAGQDLAAEGYIEEEYFIAGTARSYVADAYPPDGVWDTRPDAEADYQTRVIVRRPADPADFSGVAVIEWLNVSAGTDGDPDWGYLHPEIMRQGHAYIALSAQQTGVDALRDREDGRYLPLTHPGDPYSYDILTQTGLSARGGGSAPLLGELSVDHLVATGDSQSAFRLTTYANAVQPRVRGIFDGIFLHSRAAYPAAIGDDGAMVDEATPALIRTDLEVPVFTFQTETDVSPRLASAAIRQPDSERFRLWEVAGTAHADAHLLRGVYGLDADAIGSLLDCDQPINEGPQFEVITAAFHHFVAWVVDGTAPPSAPFIDTTGDDPAEVVRDADGIATGGIRTSGVDVPVSVLSGEGQTGGGFCGLFGTTVPFDDAGLVERYGTNEDYVAAVTESTRSAVDTGYILESEVAAIVAAAEAVTIG